MQLSECLLIDIHAARRVCSDLRVSYTQTNSDQSAPENRADLLRPYSLRGKLDLIYEEASVFLNISARFGRMLFGVKRSCDVSRNTGILNYRYGRG